MLENFLASESFQDSKLLSALFLAFLHAIAFVEGTGSFSLCIGQSKYMKGANFDETWLC